MTMSAGTIDASTFTLPGNVTVRPEVSGSWLRSIGGVEVAGVPLRNAMVRFLPWFDTYAGDVFSRFRMVSVDQRPGQMVLDLVAVSDPDQPFQERRDSSGDPVFRSRSWDSDPVQASLRVMFEPAAAEIDGRSFTGFRYWFEYAGDMPIHRLIDRQTWEVGGGLDDINVVCRAWLTKPRVRLNKQSAYSTAGLDGWAGLLPGNLWGRWSLLPAFDMQYGAAGIMLGWFDEVSLIRTVIETQPGENELRHIDMHLFESGKRVRSNPKTILHCPDQLDDLEAMNLWTRVHDQEEAKAQRQMGLTHEPAPAITLCQNQWVGFRFDSSYERTVDLAGEVGADYAFIDPVWEHQQAFRETLAKLLPEAEQKGTVLEKFWHQNMCCTLDWEVADVHGGEAQLKALCDRAAAKGVKILSWFAAHYSPNTYLQEHARDPELAKLGCGQFGIFAAKESGRHPDTGYPGSCWPVNLNGPIMERMRDQVIGVCERTGLAGFLWDSFCNLGWWHVDYSDGSMRPQVDRVLELYASFANAGLYVMSEAVISFSGRSCCGLHAGNVYDGDLLGYSYKTSIALQWGGLEGEPRDVAILKGEAPIDELFRCFAHKRAPNMELQRVPPAERDADAMKQLKELFAAYKAVRDDMVQRTVLRDDAGVLWEGGKRRVLFSFVHQHWLEPAHEALGGPPTQQLEPNRVYLLD